MKLRLKKNYQSRKMSQILLSLICLYAFTTGSMAQSIYNGREVVAKDSQLAMIAPTPTPGDGNVKCSDLNMNNAAYPQVTSNNEFKLDFQPTNGNSGPYPFTAQPTEPFDREISGPEYPGESISLQNVNTGTFDFTSTKLITAVIVKSGGGGNSGQTNVYSYPAGTFGGTPDGIGLSTQSNQAISHISFCYNPTARVNIIKQVQAFGNATASSQIFNFSATNLGAAQFSLVDDDAGPGTDVFTNGAIASFGAANTITVQEGAMPGSGWSLSDINCTGTGNQTVTEDFGNRRVSIVVNEGASVTCTFVNVQSTLTAANGALGGQIITAEGRAIRNAIVTLYNPATFETRTVRTGAFGYYSFGDLPVGNLYILSVSHKKYVFDDNSRPVTLNDDLADVNFRANN